MAALLSIEDLRVSFYTYYGIVRAVNHVTFNVYEKEILGVVGESGSGKSVTAMTIVGLLPFPGYVVGGRVSFLGRDLLSMSDDEWGKLRGKEISICFQNPSRSLNPVLTVGTQLTRVLTRHTRGISKKQAFQRAVALLQEVNIPGAERVMRQYPHQLSGGMAQRVMIVLALICQPRLIILDEPTTGLDVTVQRQLLSLLRRIQQKSVVSQILITHDLGVVANACDRVLVMYAGYVMEEAPVEELFAQPMHPYTKALLESIPCVEADASLKPIPGAVPIMTQLPSGCPFHPRCAFAREICCSEVPAYRLVSSGHHIACHLAAQGEKNEK